MRFGIFCVCFRIDLCVYVVDTSLVWAGVRCFIWALALGVVLQLAWVALLIA